MDGYTRSDGVLTSHSTFCFDTVVVGLSKLVPVSNTRENVRANVDLLLGSVWYANCIACLSPTSVFEQMRYAEPLIESSRISVPRSCFRCFTSKIRICWIGLVKITYERSSGYFRSRVAVIVLQKLTWRRTLTHTAEVSLPFPKAALSPFGTCCKAERWHAQRLLLLQLGSRDDPWTPWMCEEKQGSYQGKDPAGSRSAKLSQQINEI